MNRFYGVAFAPKTSSDKAKRKTFFRAGYDLGVIACECKKSGIPCEDAGLWKLWDIANSTNGGILSSVNGWRAGYDSVRDARIAKSSDEFWAKAAMERGAQ
jgi:hypothetical protein